MATLAHYQAQAEAALRMKAMQAEVERWKSLAERLQAQADEMRSGRAITSSAQLAELIDGVRCFHDLGAELIAEAVFEQLPDHLPDTTKMVESQWISVEDRLPEARDGTRYLVTRDCGNGTLKSNSVGFLLGGEWHISDGARSFRDRGYRVTHWMPLPAAPVGRLRDGLVEALEEWLADYDEVAADPGFEPFPHVAERVAKSRAALAAHRAGGAK